MAKLPKYIIFRVTDTIDEEGHIKVVLNNITDKVDMVEVVRCQNCVRNGDISCPWDSYHSSTPWDDYCSWGKRRAGDG